MAEKQVGSQLERISSYGPKSDLSVSEVSNLFVGSKRSHSDSAFTGSSREGIPQMIPENSHVMKVYMPLAFLCLSAINSLFYDYYL